MPNHFHLVVRPRADGDLSRWMQWLLTTHSSLVASRACAIAAPKLASEDLLRRGDWTEFVNAPITEAETAAIEQSIHRSCPFGADNWTRTTAARLGLESSLRSPRGTTSPEEN